MFLMGLLVGEMIGGLITVVIICILKVGKESEVVNYSNKCE